jgi:acyl transferase domain-containing protein
MDGMESGFYEALAALRPTDGDIPLYSTVTGGIIEGARLNAEYWWHNIRRPVQFQQAVQGMLSDGINVLVEVGPHAVLRSYLNDCIKQSGGEGRVIATLKRGDDDPQRVREISDQAVIAGIPLDWSDSLPQACTSPIAQLSLAT